MDSNLDAVNRGRCRVCLEKDVDVVALSLTLCVFAEEITVSQMLYACCAIEISASDLKPQTMCNNCAKTAEQSFTFRKICQNADIVLQKELDGINIKFEPDEFIIKEEHEEDDHKNGIIEAIKYEFPDSVSTSTTDDRTQLQSKLDTGSIEKFRCKICETYFADWISLEHHLENCYRSVGGDSEHIFKSDDTLNEQALTHEAQLADKQVVLKQRKKLNCHRCSFCKTSYKFPAVLGCHLMIHKTVMHFFCLYCRNKFSLSHRSKCEQTQSQHSRKHINKETNNRASDSLKKQSRYCCSVCKKSYRRQETLMNHTSINGTNKFYKCSQCGKEFASTVALRDHTRTQLAKNVTSVDTAVNASTDYGVLISINSLTRAKNLTSVQIVISALRI